VFPFSSIQPTIPVRNGNPAKQGLKLGVTIRINKTIGSRPKRKSSKTRIETFVNSVVTVLGEGVRNGNPAKQGLKQD